MAYRRRMERLVARRDQEAGQSVASLGIMDEDGSKCSVKYNGDDHVGSYPVGIAELMGSAPDNMMI
jgi:hypothetical protein